MTDRFKLEVHVVIEKTVREQGYDRTTGERLSVREEMLIEADNFTQIAGILGQFHGLAEQINTDRRES